MLAFENIIKSLKLLFIESLKLVNSFLHRKGRLKYVNKIGKQNTRSKDSLNRSQYTNTALLDTTP